MTPLLLQGDCLHQLKTIPDNSVDSIVTDPPYGLSKQPDAEEVLRHWLNGDDYTHKGGGFMGKTWDSFVPGPSVWKECFRVLKPGGHLLSFFGSRTYDLGTMAIRLAGFEIRDQIMWIFASGYPKSKDNLKPAHEPIAIARKPFKGSLKKNMETHGLGGLNIEKSRLDCGRWPSNIIHDGSEIIVNEFPDAKGQQGDIKGHDKDRQSPNGILGKMGPAKDFKARIDDSKSASRFFYCAKATREDRHSGLNNPGPQLKHGSTFRKVENAELSGNNHPTVKPYALMAYLVNLVTPEGGTVLDPFMGSGSTGKAAIMNGFNFIGIEREVTYFNIAKSRIAQAVEDAIKA